MANTEFNHSTSLLNRGYTGHEHFFGVGLIHMNGRLYDAKLGRFLAPDNFVQDPYNTQNFNRYSYVLNNPLMYSDPSGEIIIPMLIGALVNVIINGINNRNNGQAFFQGAFDAGIYGALAGGVSAGIGAAFNAGGVAALFAESSPGWATAIQTVAHAHLGGFMTTTSGGSYLHGFISGGVSSFVAGNATSMFDASSNKYLQAAIMTGLGGAMGGFSSALAGGNFWDGMRNGLISAGLNHAAHLGVAALQNRGQGNNPFGRALLHDAYFNRGQTAMGVGGIAYGIGEYGIYNSQWGYWLGKNGKYNSTRWGGNRFTGARSLAQKYSSYWKVAGRVTFWSSAVLSAYDFYGHYQNRDYNAMFRSGIDITMGAIGVYGGPWGFALSSVYFGGMWAIDNGYISGGSDWSKSPDFKGRYICFVAGTPITLSNGSTKSIEEIKAGDIIKSFDVVNKTIEKDTVLEVQKSVNIELIEIEFENGLKNINSTTHPYLVKNKGWASFSNVDAEKYYDFDIQKLEIGDTCKWLNNDNHLEDVTIKTIKSINKKTTTYNLTRVKKNHNFFANGILVHNKYID